LWEIVTQGVDYKYSWTPSTNYKAKDIVKYGGDIWLCTTDHTSIATFQTGNWTLYVPGIRFRNDWSSTSYTYTISALLPGVPYIKNDLVQYNGIIYRFTMSGTLTLDIGDIPWILTTTMVEIVPPIGVYAPGDIVGYGGYNYISKTHNTDAVPSVSTSDWTLLTTGFKIKGSWSSTTQYYVGDVVRRNGQLYVCILDNLNTETTNTGFWTLVVSGNEWNGIWLSGNTYVIGDLVSFNTSTYRCILKHVSASNNNPIADTSGTYWNRLVAGAINEPMTATGDTISYQSANIAIPVGTLANTYKASTVPYWEKFGVISNVFYVAPTGTDSTTFGISLEQPFKTIKYACDYIASLNVPSATLFIKTGTYSEILPITVVAGLELVGDEIRSTVVQPASGYTTSNMFYVRNGSGIRNMTLSGLVGTLGAANEYGTSRPTAGAYVSLDPGTGPADSSTWITTKSPYVQNVSTFGTGCVGLKVDSTLHNGGNRSVVANDFTQILSDGIGVWCTGTGALTELVSVFSYYGHIGYLAENGGKIRATNGNSSYGTYGTVAEGYDLTESPLVGAVNNRTQYAQVASSFAGQAQDKILVLEYLNAGQEYTMQSAPSALFTGAGTGASVVFDEFRDNAIFEAFVVGSTYSAGGSGYITGGNQAQSGSATTITIASNDQRTSANYVGMRIIINSGTGVGQYGYIQSYDAVSKVATIYKESTSVAGWDHVIPGTLIASVLDSTTVYSIEPRVTFSTPLITLTSVSSAANTSAIAYGNGKFVSVGGTGTGVIAYSTTGSSWTSGTGTVGFNSPTVAFAAASNTFVAINASGSVYGYSTDGIAWTSGTLMSSNSNSEIIAAGTKVAYVSFNANRTNLLGRSEDFSNASRWTLSQASVISNATIAPDGNMTADKIVANAVATSHIVTSASYSVTANVPYTASIFVKNDDYARKGIRINMAGVVADYDLISLTAVMQSNPGSTAVSYSIIPLDNGWYRCSLTYTVNTDTVNMELWLSNGYNLGFAGNGVSGMYFWGAQLEIGSYASGYIPTFGYPAASATTELLSSSNGTSWTALGCPSITGGPIAYGGNTYVSFLSGNTNQLAYSTNQLAWTTVILPTTATWASVTYGNGRFIAIANSGTNAVYSLDGITWVLSTLPISSTWTKITYNQGVFFAVSNSVNSATTNDGVMWVLQTLPINLWNSVAIGSISSVPTAVAIDTTGNTQAITLGTRALGRVIAASGKIGGIKIWNPGSGYLTVPSISQFTGSITGTTLSVTAVSSVILPTVGMLLGGGLGNILANTSITAQNSTTFTGFISNFSLTITDITSGVITTGLVLTGLSISSGTTVTGLDSAIFTGSISGTTLTVSAMTSGVIYAGMTLTGGSIPTGTYIVSNISGAGTNSTWTVSTSVAQSSTIISGVRYTVNINQTVQLTGITGNSFTVNISQTVNSVYMQGFTAGSAVVTITDPNATTAAILTCRTGNGVLGNPTFISRGTNYQTSTTTCKIIGGNGYADVNQTSKYLTVSNLTYQPSLGSSLVIANDPTDYKVVNVSATSADPYFNNVVLFLTGDDLLDHSLSNVALSNIVDRITVSTLEKYTGTGSLYFPPIGGGFALPQITVSEDFTWEVWLKRTVPVIHVYTIVTALAGGESIGWYGNSTTWRVQFSNVSANFTIPDTINQWAHYAVVKSGNTIRVFVNGVEYGSVGATSDTILKIDSIGDTSLKFVGYMDNLRISNIARYTKNFTPPTSIFSSYTIQISPTIDRVLTPVHGTSVSIRQKYSQVRLTGHDYLLIGTGNRTTTDYPNVDITTAASFKQVQENNLGRVFVTSTDQDGNFNVGGLFGVQQATGIVTVSADLFNLNGITSLSLGGVQVGINQVAITQFSTDSYFVANSDSIVPTERAIKSYIARAISAGGSNAQTSILTAGTVQIGPYKINSSISGRVKINNKMNFKKGIDGTLLAMNYFKQSWQ
jgi:hypothetical protein